jgi:hypothetical protein
MSPRARVNAVLAVRDRPNVVRRYWRDEPQLLELDARVALDWCPTASHCLAIGWYSNFSPRTGPDVDHGVLLTSDDGGAWWRHRTWPNGYGRQC